MNLKQVHIKINADDYWWVKEKNLKHRYIYNKGIETIKGETINLQEAKESIEKRLDTLDKRYRELIIRVNQLQNKNKNIGENK